MRDIDVDLLEHRHDHALFLHEKRGEEMERGDLVVAAFNGELVRSVDGFLRFCCVVVEWCHTLISC